MRRIRSGIRGKHDHDNDDDDDDEVLPHLKQIVLFTTTTTMLPHVTSLLAELNGNNALEQIYFTFN